ncbi:hypothetical protein C0431_08255 [bacterium]|nr:hypothetical protein [bacterium]
MRGGFGMGDGDDVVVRGVVGSMAVESSAEVVHADSGADGGEGGTESSGAGAGGGVAKLWEDHRAGKAGDCGADGGGIVSSKRGLFCKNLQKGLTACFEMLEDSVDLRFESMTQALMTKPVSQMVLRLFCKPLHEASRADLSSGLAGGKSV